jgi:hypothetical protein
MAPGKTHNSRRALAGELLGCIANTPTTLPRMEDLKRALREIATDEGENFKEEFAGEGVVKVSGAKKGKFQDLVPEAVPEAHLP